MTVKKLLHQIVLNGLEYFGIYYSKYECIVADINDPDQLGRVRVNNRGLFGVSASSWCLPSGMFAGVNKCLFALPNIGDIVFLSFKNGNLQYPVWEYGYWAKGELPSEVTDDYTNVDMWKTKSGLILKFDNTNEDITLIHPNGLEIKLSEDKIKLAGTDHKAVLGDILLPELNKLSSNVDLIINAIQNGVPIPQDGGTGYQISMSAILAAAQVPDFSQINSETVTLK